MAIIPNQESNAFIREVAEDMRREDMLRFFKKYGKWLLAATLTVALAVGGYFWWREHTLKQQYAWNNSFHEALNKPDGKKAKAAFEDLVSDSNGKSFGLLAAYAGAALAGRDGASNVAAEQYELLAAQAGSDPLLAPLATLAAANRRMGKDLPASLQQSLETTAAQNSPWQFSAREALALHAFTTGNTTKARKEWESLYRDLAAPEGLKERARQMLALLPASPAPETPKTPANTPPQNIKK